MPRVLIDEAALADLAGIAERMGVEHSSPKAALRIFHGARDYPNLFRDS
jgi:hypothetical protein